MKRTPLKRTGKKQTADTSEMRKARASLQARSNGVCEQCDAARATEAHHIKRKSQGGTNTLDNLVHLCGPCHWWVHANPAESANLGLLHLTKGIEE